MYNIKYVLWNSTYLQCGQEKSSSWSFKTKKTNKLLDLLLEYETLLAKTDMICCNWQSSNDLDILFSNCILVRLMFTNEISTLEGILIDKSLVGKLSSSVITSAVFLENLLVCGNVTSGFMDIITWNFKNSRGNLTKPDKLSSMNMKITQMRLSGEGSKYQKHFCKSPLGDTLIIWWSVPTSPAHNISLYTIKNGSLEYSFGMLTEQPIQNIYFNKSKQDEFLVIESSNIPQPGENRVLLEIGTFNIRRADVSKIGSQSLSTRSPITSCELHPHHLLLLITLQDCLLLSYDIKSAQTNEINAKINVSGISWHKDGVVFFAWSIEGNIRLFDVAGQSLPFTLQENDLISLPKSDHNIIKILKSANKIKRILWNHQNLSTFSTLCVLHERGPLCILKMETGRGERALSLSFLLQDYLSRYLFPQAIHIVRALYWDREPELCYTLVTLVINSLLLLTLDKTRIRYLEDCLGSFYLNTQQIPDSIQHQFKDKMMCLTRRFFFHLLRFGYFEKAFLLAEDIGDSDLFMDLFHESKMSGDMVLAEVARLKAESLESGTPEKDNNSSDSGSEVTKFLAMIPDEAFNPPDERGDDFSFEDRLITQFQQILSGPTKSTFGQPEIRTE